MTRTSLIALLLAGACSGDGLRTVERTHEPASAPGGDSDPGDGDPPLTPADADPGDVDAPVPCMFYGVDEHGTLWRIDPETVTATAVGASGIEGVTDIGITPQGAMLAVTRSSLYRLSPSTAEATLLGADLFGTDQVAADATPDGKLLIGGDREVAKIDPVSLEITVRGDLLPSGWMFSGDYAVIDARTAYASATNLLAIDHLFFLDLAAGTNVNLGSMGRSFVFGIDFGCDGELYGVQDGQPPHLLRLTAGSSSVSVQDLGGLEGPPSLWGATGPAL